MGEPDGAAHTPRPAHAEAYWAVPCMGAVVHTLNIRLSAEQLDLVLRG